MRVAAGISSCSNSICFAPVSTVKLLTPVILPPGRLRLAANPIWTGSPPVEKTIGMVEVAAFAASRAGVVVATITVTNWRTRSAASAGNRSYSPRAQRYSIATFRLSTKPASSSPWRNARKRSANSPGDSPLRNPITGIFRCCARAASGHAAVEPPSRARNSRLRMPASIAKSVYRTLSLLRRARQVLGVGLNCSESVASPGPKVRLGQIRPWRHVRVESVLLPTSDINWRGRHGRKVPILLQKSAIRTTKRPTQCFEAHVAVCSIGSRL
jgi:hypothetical protein